MTPMPTDAAPDVCDPTAAIASLRVALEHHAATKLRRLLHAQHAVREAARRPVPVPAALRMELRAAECAYREGTDALRALFPLL